jgi:hypothetical protein
LFLQIGHRHEVVHAVNRQAALEQPVALSVSLFVSGLRSFIADF